MRRSFALLIVILLLMPNALAQSNPQIGYIPGETASDAIRDAANTYEFTLLIDAAEGDDSVDLEIRYQAGSGRVAPATEMRIRPLDDLNAWIDIAPFDGFDVTRTANIAVPEPEEGEQPLIEYRVEVNAYFDFTDAKGDYKTGLRFLARDPDTSSSSPAIRYDYTFTLPNQAPEAAFEAIKDGNTVDVDATDSNDDDGDALSYAWNFGDGTTAEGITASHEYTAGPGDVFAYTIQLTADDGEATDTASRTVTIRGPPDADDDDIADDDDNCPDDANPLQGDLDEDGKGDACDPDRDGDGFSNTDEVAAGSDPDDANSLPPPPDADDDGVPDEDDNCPDDANPTQGDLDEDTIGDACDADRDGDDYSNEEEIEAGSDPDDAGSIPAAPPAPDADEDGVPDEDDNCPDDANPLQGDLDDDNTGDACDDDRDGDGISNTDEEAAGSDPDDEDSQPIDPNEVDSDDDGTPDVNDNCPNTKNADQANQDSDTQGDSCDADRDGDGTSNADELTAGSDPDNVDSTPTDKDADGILNDDDNCPGASNGNQLDADGDGIGDACDKAPQDGPLGDPDGDGISSKDDNCPATDNNGQLDLDKDGKGDACDADMDGDGRPNELDAFPRNGAEQDDTDKDGTGNNADQDDDNDGFTDAEESAKGSNPLDRQDPPFKPVKVASLKLKNNSYLVAWEAPIDPRVERFVVWREASPLVVVGSFLQNQKGSYNLVDPNPPARARYHVQAQLEAQTQLVFEPVDARTTNWVTTQGPSTEGCEGLPDRDGDGICDALEIQMGLNPDVGDSDGDGIADGLELLSINATSLPFTSDSDGDGIPDDVEIQQGTDSFDETDAPPPENPDTPGLGLLATMALIAAIAVVVRRRS